MRSAARHLPPEVVQYDKLHRRLWIFGQRCHHGAAGSLVAAAVCLAWLGGPLSAQCPRLRWALATAGGAMMLHDRKDRPIWFERGRGSQA